MDNTTDFVTDPELQEAVHGYVAGLVILAVILTLVIVLGCLVTYLLYKKLKQHEEDIIRLQDAERGLKLKANKNNGVNSHGDSAIEMGSIDQGDDTDSLGDLDRPRSSCSFSGPQCSVKIRQQRTSVYGCTPQTSQLLMVAQDYHKSTTGTVDVIPPESVKVLDKDQHIINRASNVFTDDWKAGRPTSMLLDSLGDPLVTNLVNNKAIFIHKTVDSSGGKLEISGITLRIPRGALSAPTLITLGVVWEEKFNPVLSRKKSLLSPIILCQPCGLTFKTPVTLTFPHCAENVKEDWNVTIMKRDGDLQDPNVWTDVGFEDFSERSITVNEINLKLNHFTLYTCIGESREDKIAAKHVHLVGFVSPLSPGSLFKPRIYCLNNYKELKDVETVVNKMAAGSKVSETTDVMVHDNEQDLVIKLGKLLPSDRWKLNGGNSEMFPFEQVWHGLSPHVTYLLKPLDRTVSEIYCEFTCYQIQRENITARLKIAEEKIKSFSPLAVCAEYPDQEVINQIIILLDPLKDGDTGDWRDLAEKLGCDVARITWLGTQSSPTRLLIDVWLEENQSFSELAKIMLEINRPDVAEEINKRFPGV